MNISELATIVSDLAERVAALEAAPPPSRAVRGATDLAIVQAIMADLPVGDDGAPENGTVIYAGAGPGPDGLTALQMERRWDQLLTADPIAIASCLAALGNPQRVQIVQMLLHGPASTAEITEALAGPSSGQLFHHLKELLAAGLIYQPSRGTYAIRIHHVVPLLTAVSCAMDLSVPTDQGDT